MSFHNSPDGAAENAFTKKELLIASFTAGATTSDVEVVFSFDTTGSMYSCLQEVRREIETTVERLLRDIPGVRIGIIAHGDYCDDTTSSCVTVLDFSNDHQKIVKFIENVKATNGDDAPECYEYALRKASEMSWSPLCQNKALVIIGDDIPHPPSYTSLNIFWKNELSKLKSLGVKLYGVQALSNRHAKPFYQHVADVTGGVYVNFKDFTLITDMFLAICYREYGSEQLETYRQEVVKQGRMNSGLSSIFKALSHQIIEKFSPNANQHAGLKYAWWDVKYDTLALFPTYTYDDTTGKFKKFVKMEPNDNEAYQLSTDVLYAKLPAFVKKDENYAVLPRIKRRVVNDGADVSFVELYKYSADGVSDESPAGVSSETLVSDSAATDAYHAEVETLKEDLVADNSSSDSNNNPAHTRSYVGKIALLKGTKQRGRKRKAHAINEFSDLDSSAIASPPTDVVSELPAITLSDLSAPTIAEEPPASLKSKSPFFSISSLFATPSFFSRSFSGIRSSFSPASSSSSLDASQSQDMLENSAYSGDDNEDSEAEDNDPTDKSAAQRLSPESYVHPLRKSPRNHMASNPMYTSGVVHYRKKDPAEGDKIRAPVGSIVAIREAAGGFWLAKIRGYRGTDKVVVRWFDSIQSHKEYYVRLRWSDTISSDAIIKTGIVLEHIRDIGVWKLITKQNEITGNL